MCSTQERYSCVLAMKSGWLYFHRIFISGSTIPCSLGLCHCGLIYLLRDLGFVHNLPYNSYIYVHHKSCQWGCTIWKGTLFTPKCCILVPSRYKLVHKIYIFWKGTAHVKAFLSVQILMIPQIIHNVGDTVVVVVVFLPNIFEGDNIVRKTSLDVDWNGSNIALDSKQPPSNI